MRAAPNPDAGVEGQREAPDVYSELREKAALAIANLMGHDNWRRWTKEADAVSVVTIDALIEMDLPEEAVQDALDAYHAESEHEIRPSIVAAYRALLTALKPLLTKGGA